MKNKLLSRALAVMVTAFFFGMLLAPAISLAAQHIRPVGKTTQQASQLVFWYDEANSSTDRHTHIMVTNASIDTPVNVHVQIFASSCTLDALDVCIPSTLVICAETDFNDFYTPRDTHTYWMDEVLTNDPTQPTFLVGDFDGTKGFVVVTPIDAPGTRAAIAHQHMFGHSFVEDSIVGSGFGVSATGRDAVSFSTGNVVADGTLLDGVDNGYVLLQPDKLKFNFAASLYDEIDIISIAFSDNYAGAFGYVATPAGAVWTPLVFNEFETPISCNPVVQDCFFNIGLNPQLPQSNELLGIRDLCPNNPTIDGFVKVAVSGVEGLENELGLIGFTDTGVSFCDGNTDLPSCVDGTDCALTCANRVCSESGASCVDLFDCPIVQGCVGNCTIGGALCIGDSGCAQTCDGRRCLLGSISPCTSNEDCGSVGGFICLPGNCTLDGLACANDGDCTTTLTCDEVDNFSGATWMIGE
ncbi:MAG: hypothetical protein IH874_03810 [Candidatus Dadabacteria bacterium]|nr:hypothetical protein [Candidatus Dadabacteria bacterium]